LCLLVKIIYGLGVSKWDLTEEIGSLNCFIYNLYVQFGFICGNTISRRRDQEDYGKGTGN